MTHIDCTHRSKTLVQFIKLSIWYTYANLFHMLSKNDSFVEELVNCLLVYMCVAYYGSFLKSYLRFLLFTWNYI
jgi:hypothetical protein